MLALGAQIAHGGQALERTEGPVYDPLLLGRVHSAYVPRLSRQRLMAASRVISSEVPALRLRYSTTPAFTPLGPTTIISGTPMSSMVENLAPGRSAVSSYR